MLERKPVGGYDVAKIKKYFNKGYVAMNEDETWIFTAKKPFVDVETGSWMTKDIFAIESINGLNIRPYRDWTKSCMKVG